MSLSFYSRFNISQAPDGTNLEVPRPELVPGRNPKYQIHLKSESEQIFVLLINKEQNSEPVVVQVPPPPEIAAALKRETGTDILTAATTLSRGIKRERVEEAGPGTVKRTRYDGESEPGSEDYYETSSERDAGETAVVSAPVQSSVNTEFSMTNIQTDIPGLEDILTTESKIVKARNDGYNEHLFSVFGPLIRLSPPPTEKDYCYNLDNSEGVCDLFDVL